MRTRRGALIVAACAGMWALSACAQATDDPVVAGPAASVTPTGAPTTAVPAPTARATAPTYPTTADDYTADLVQAWQAHDVARMTDLAGPKVAAFLDGLKAPTKVEPYEDASDSGRTSVHLVGDKATLEIDITVDYVDSGLGKAHAIIDIADANVDQTITG